MGVRLLDHYLLSIEDKCTSFFSSILWIMFWKKMMSWWIWHYAFQRSHLHEHIWHGQILLQDIFTALYPPSTPMMPGWQRAPQFGMGYAMQYPAGVVPCHSHMCNIFYTWVVTVFLSYIRNALSVPGNASISSWSISSAYISATYVFATCIFPPPACESFEPFWSWEWVSSNSSSHGIITKMLTIDLDLPAYFIFPILLTCSLLFH
jgi:hypothetical protein